MAALRAEIAERQAEAYAELVAWAMGAFGPGYAPKCRHFLVEKDEEAAARREGRVPRASATVYAVRHDETGQDRHFIVEDGKVREVAGYAEGFGTMLTEPHETAGFEHRGQFCRTHKYSLCWTQFDLYEPKVQKPLPLFA